MIKVKRLRYYSSVLKSEILFLPYTLSYFFSKKKRAIYIGATGQGNLGDEAVLRAIKEITKEKIFIYPISYAKPNSGYIGRKFFLKSPEFIILGGGTIIKKKKDESYLKLLFKYQDLYPSAKLVLLGAGVADPDLAEKVGFPTDIKSWVQVLNNFYFISIRGEISKKILIQEWKIKKEVEILGDPAIYFKRNKLIAKKKQKRIGLNFCDILGRIYGQDQNEIKVLANGLVKRLLKDDWTVYLYPTQRNDINYMKSIIATDLFSQLNIYDNYNNLEESLSFLSNLDLFVGQRLHSIIFSSLVYTPFYAIEYESKTSDFLTSINMSHRKIRTDELNVDKVIFEIDEIYLHLNEEQENLYKNVNQSYNKFIEVFNNFLQKA